jgi:prepilin-type N-terminal cleavage/methylation domain-containing protein
MNKKGFTLVELLVVIAIIALLMGILMPALARVRQIAFRMVCGTNLSGIGKAMLIYANDYEDELPRAGGRNGVWGGPVVFDAQTRQAAYGTDAGGNGGKATITSCFYLLVKYAEVTPKSFLCKGDSGVSEFKPADYGAGARELIDLWDFGGPGADIPVNHCSYSLHLPFDKYALTTSSDPGMAVAGDRNPWMAGPFGDKTDEITLFSWADRERMKHGNAMQHQDEGQNVLFLDSHVGFEKSPICGINEDNIWTYWDGGDIRKGTPTGVWQLPTVQGNRRQDSLLVTDGDGTATSAGGGTGGGGTGGGGGTAR